MAYRFKRKEHLARGMHRVAREEIRAAIGHLAADSGDVNVHVHEARKSVKKLRALLRLVRRPLRERFKREDRALRDIGRNLRAWRESAVAANTAAAFRDAATGAHAEQWQAVVEILSRDTNGAEPSIETFSEATGNIAFALRIRESSIDEWTFHDDGFELIAPGLRHIHQRVRRHFHKTFASDDPHASHVWRRHVKYHWYHVRLLEDTWPERLAGYRGLLGELAEYLGDEHDLIDLSARLDVAERESPGTRPLDFPGLRADIARKREQLRGESRRLGAYITAESSDAIVARLSAYYQIWKRDSAA
ncbi:MAG: CHAD domain-containing protein [Gammaproteobacteria bacterium]|nr:CHAD domain-containing protein [Gammaproteobacteria bacterium]